MRSVFWHGMSVLGIAFTLLVNVFAVTALLDAWGFLDTAWKEPLYELGKVYMVPVCLLGGWATEPIEHLFRDSFALPSWWVHLLAIYGASAGAIWMGTMSESERAGRISEIKRGGISVIFPLAIIGYIGSLIVQGFRGRIVSQFMTQNFATTVLYAAAVFGLVFGARWANTELIEGPVALGPSVAGGCAAVEARD